MPLLGAEAGLQGLALVVEQAKMMETHELTMEEIKQREEAFVKATDECERLKYEKDVALKELSKLRSSTEADSEENIREINESSMAIIMASLPLSPHGRLNRAT